MTALPRTLFSLLLTWLIILFFSFKVCSNITLSVRSRPTPAPFHHQSVTLFSLLYFILALVTTLHCSNIHVIIFFLSLLKCKHSVKQKLCLFCPCLGPLCLKYIWHRADAQYTLVELMDRISICGSNFQ